MKVEVVTPEDYLGDVIGDLNSRRGQIQGTDTRGNAQAVEAMVPLANMPANVNPTIRSTESGLPHRRSYVRSLTTVSSPVVLLISSLSLRRRSSSFDARRGQLRRILLPCTLATPRPPKE